MTVPLHNPIPGQILLADLSAAHVQAMFTAVSRQHAAVAVWTPTQTAAFLNFIRGHRLYAAHHLIALCPPKTARSERVIAPGSHHGGGPAGAPG